MSAPTRDLSEASGVGGASTPRLAPWNTTVPARAPRSRRRTAFRAIVLVVVAVVAAWALSAVIAGPPRSGLPLDPGDAGRSGARAAAEVLRQQGVDVSVVRGIDDLERTLGAADSRARWTVVLTDATYLGQGAAERLTRAVEQTRRFVVVEPDDVELGDLALPLTVTDRSGTSLTAGCRSDVADPNDRLGASWSSYGLLAGLAGDVRSGSARDRTPPARPTGPDTSAAPQPPLLARSATGATVCFLTPDASSGSSSGGTGSTSRGSGSAPADAPAGARSGAVVILPREGRAPETVVLGSAAALSNGKVLDAAHAALTLRALGPTEHLLWYVPGVSDLDAPDPSGRHVADPGRGVPEWLVPASWLLAAAVVAFALARGRRLGRLVVEPLRVVVRAVETTEARGRLYHRAADRPLAARALRTGTRTRLADRLGLPRETPVVALVEAATRASGHPHHDVEQLLDGPDPTTDRDLLLLAQRLADLEESVRSA
ncbi:DUF4350 domain-containing protein [Terrabacter sp. 2RAF25]|uniref:DUF4350 domain-containing protein n=1 Tax=Terrabacter sp. 2RAF25 TaxID=3232998 RepID=UPI003F988ADB